MAFFNQIPQGMPPPSQQPAPQMPPPGAMAPQPPPQPPPMSPQMMQMLMQQQQAMQGAAQPGGTGGGATQGTPGLDILKLLLLMKQGKNAQGPMSGGVGSTPAPSLNMPFSLSNDGSGMGIYDVIAKIIAGQSGVGGAMGALQQFGR